MANSNAGNDQLEPDQSTSDQTTPEQQNHIVMELLTTMNQAMIDDRTTMRQFMGNVTRQLANPLAPIESLWVNLRNPLDGDATQKRFIHIGVNPNVEEGSDPEQYWERGLNEMPPERRRQYLAFIGSRIKVAPGEPPQVPGGEGASASSQDDVAALMHTRDTRIQGLEEELRQARARLSPNTSAPQSNADPIAIAQMQPSAAAERVTSAVPEASRPSVQKATAQLPTVKTSDKSKGPVVDGATRRDPDRSEESSGEVVEEKNSNIAPSNTKKPAIPRQSLNDTASGPIKPGTSTSPGRRNTVAETQSTELGSRDTTLGDTGESKRKNDRYRFRDLNAVKKEKTTDYEIDNDPNRKKFFGYKNITKDPPRNDFQAGDPDSAWKKTRKGRPARRTGSEAPDGAQNSTSVSAQDRGRANSSPSLTTTAARLASTSASRVHEHAESNRSNVEESPRKHRKANVLDDIGEEPESEPDASSSSSEEEDDDGQAARIRDRRPSGVSGDGDEPRNAPRARQHANFSPSQTTKGSKNQRVEKQDRQDAPSTKTRARNPEREEDESDNDAIQNLKTPQQSKRPSEISETDPADLLPEHFGSDNDSPNADVPDEFFDESFVDDSKSRPKNEDGDQDDEEEHDFGNWVDGVEAKHSDEAHTPYRRHPSSITKHNNARQPSTAHFREKRGPPSSRVERHADDSDTSQAGSARTGEKRKSNSPSQAAEPDEEEDTGRSPKKKQKPNKAKLTPGPESKSKQEEVVGPVRKKGFDLLNYRFPRFAAKKRRDH